MLRPFRSMVGSNIARYSIVLLSVAAAVAVSIPIRGYAYPRPLVLLALVLSVWGRGLGPGLLGAAAATVLVRVTFPQLEPTYGIVSDAAMFGLAALTFSAFSGAKARAEAALRESEARLKLVQRAARLGIWDRDLRSNQILTSGEYASLHGLSPDQHSLTFEQWLSSVHPDDRVRMPERLQECLEQTRVWDQEFRTVWPDGTVRWVLAKGTVYTDGTGRPQRMVGVSLDITPRKEAEAALRESEERFRRVFEEGPLGLALVGKDYRFFKVNSALCSMVGYSAEELTGKSFEDVTHPDDLESDRELARKLFTREIQNYRLQKRYLKKNGDTIWINLTASVIRDAEGLPLYGLAMVEDITAIKLAQEEAMVRQKLESIGVLASGIAHDFNNLLGAILVKAELAETDVASGASPTPELQSIRALTLRAAEIVRELMIFAGHEGPTLEPVNLSGLVEEMLQLLRVSISKHATLNTDLALDLPAVLGNAPQIRQMVMNLVLNASEAIRENGGLIRVITSRALGCRESPNLAPSDFLRLEVSDTGCGMTDEDKARIFDPFFTTKSAGRGLGLSVVKGVVQAHGGEIHVKSAPGRGTSFRVFLPCMPAVAPDRSGENQTASSREIRVGSVLIVEDEELLRLSVCKMLRRKGFSVLEAGDGSAAIDVIRSNERLHLILLDMTIPGATSRDVITEAKRLRPAAKIIVTSAFSRDQVMNTLDGPQISAFIRKPYMLTDLVQLLSEVL